MLAEGDIRRLIAYGSSGSAQLPGRFEDAEAMWQRLLCGDGPWLELADSLDERDLQGLIKGLVLLSSVEPAAAGSVSPVIPLYRRFRERFVHAEPYLTDWIVGHRANPYEPFGTPHCNDARSYEAFVRATQDRDEVKRRRRVEAEEAAAKQRRQRSTQEARDATIKLPDAIRRGDASAVEALLAKGADAMAAAAMAGMPLSELAAKQGRSAVLILLSE